MAPDRITPDRTADRDRRDAARVVIVGGGVAGLAAAHYLLARSRASRRPLRVTVVEGARRAGGKVLTEHADGFVIEGGPDSLLASKPKAIELVRELGLGDRLLACDDSRRRVMVERGGRLVEVPAGLKLMVPTRLAPFLRSPLFSWPAKARILAERLVPARRSGGPESLAAFVRRRLGREALERLADPVMSSIHLGDPERLDLEATFPAFAAAERRFGSLTRAARRPRPVRQPGAGDRRDVSSRTDPARTTGPRPAPLFYTLRGGLSELIDALTGRLAGSAGVTVRLGQPATAVFPGGGDGDTGDGGDGTGFVVELGGGESLPADAVILAVPAFAAAGLLAPARPELARELGELRYVSAATVALGYPAGALASPPRGFGFFVPATAHRAVVAATLSSNKFADRAPAGATLLRAFVGGARGERWVDLTDDELVPRVRREVEALLGIAADPCLVRVHRWPHGYPQYELGHRAQVARIEQLADDGLFFAGSAYHGPGIPDTLVSSERAAETVLASLGGRRSSPSAVKRTAGLRG